MQLKKKLTDIGKVKQSRSNEKSSKRIEEAKES